MSGTASEAAVYEALLPKMMGPVIIANALNAVLYGLCVLQLLHYYSMGTRDSFHNQALVWWTFAVDTAHTVSSIWMLWFYTVDNFGDPMIVTVLPWPYLSLPVFIILASLPIQQYFALRIRALSGSWPIFIALSTLSLASSSVGIANSVKAFTTPTTLDFTVEAHLVDVWLTLSMVCDGLLAALMYWYLRRSRTGFQRTDSIISRIIHSCVESTGLNSLLCLCDLIIFNLYNQSNYNLLIALPMGRVYTITLLGMLNSRLAVRDELQAELSQNSHAMRPSRVERQIDLSGTARSTEVKMEVGDEEHLSAFGSGSRESVGKANTITEAYSVSDGYDKGQSFIPC